MLLPHGVMFHHFHGGRHAPGQGSLSADGLHRLLDFLDPSRLLSAEEWLRHAMGGSLQPGMLCLTFDDGLKCQYDIAAPVLAERGLTAFFFVPSAVLEGGTLKLEIYRHVRHACFPSMETFYAAFEESLMRSPHASAAREALHDFSPTSYLPALHYYTDADRRFRFLRDRVLGQERYEEIMDRIVADCGPTGRVDLAALPALLWMSPDDVRNLRRQGHVIGLHSHSHPTDIAALALPQQEEEYRRNRDCLSSLLDEHIVSMSHPCNAYSPATLTILRSLGIRMGFRSMLEGGSTDPLELPRQDHAHVFAMMNAS
ncbi:MAG: polysaccharide deacetylase family protein [Candidatus Peribacteraceae bacterium]|nr:polysaccharide deacetylase family protein [Candidatus Peribacteraceae bacterium]